MKKNLNLFISYQKEDSHHKHLMEAWSKNKNFKLQFSDKSTDLSVNSKDKNYIKQVIREDIKSCNTLAVIVGESTYKSDYVDYEIENAYQNNKTIVGVCINKENTLPDNLKKYANSIVIGFELKKIESALMGTKNTSHKSSGIELKRIKCW